MPFQSRTEIKKDVRLTQGLKLPYPRHDGSPNPYWARFFLDPASRCGTVLSAETTLKHEDLIDSIYNRFIAKNRLFYNTFVCKEGVAHYLYDRKRRILYETVIRFDDEAFTRKLPKKPYAFYRIALKNFLDRAKESLKRGKTVTLFLGDYMITMNKNHFLIEKEGQTVVKNVLNEIVYNDMNELVINPYTDKSVHIGAPKSVYDFFLFYLSIWRPRKNAEKSIVKPVGQAKRFLADFSRSVLWLVLLFGVMIALWIADASLNDEISDVRMAIEGFVALVVAEIVYGILQSKGM